MLRTKRSEKFLAIALTQISSRMFLYWPSQVPELCYISEEYFKTPWNNVELQVL